MSYSAHENDVKFTGEWVENCSYVCFHIDYDPASARTEGCLMQLWLRNDVLIISRKNPQRNLFSRCSRKRSSHWWIDVRKT